MLAKRKDNERGEERHKHEADSRGRQPISAKSARPSLRANSTARTPVPSDAVAGNVAVSKLSVHQKSQKRQTFLSPLSVRAVALPRSRSLVFTEPQGTQAERTRKTE